MIPKLIDPSSRQAKVDEFGELSRLIDSIQPSLTRHKSLAEEIRSWYADLPAGDTAIAQGNAYSVQVSARKWERSIRNMCSVQRALGLKEFLKYCSFPLSAIDRLFHADNAAKFVTREQTGSRTLKAVANTAPAEYQEAA